MNRICLKTLVIFNASKNIVKHSGQPSFIIFGNYKERVKFNKANYSLTLKYLGKGDSGLYEARVTGEDDVTVAQYKLTVLGKSYTPN